MTTALVLSGGGATGSFEVGVLKYLYAHLFRPDIICSTSVGSVNGLKLAEGEGPQPNRGFSGLEQLWLGMQSNSDMYVPDPWVQNSPGWIQDILNGNFGPFSIPELIPVIMIGLLPGVLIDVGERAGELADFINTAANAKGIYNLGPISALATTNVNLELLGSIRLRMTTVGLGSGATRYITERGELVADPTLATEHDPPQVDIIKGMIASASIPAWFEAQNMAGDWYVDGGIRQEVPIEAAVAMKATIVYAVVSPVPLQPDTGTSCDPPLVDYSGKGLPDIALRAATDITIDQIMSDNISPPRGWGVPTLVIQPGVQVEGSRTIDPGLIRMNIAYGFMRAFDVLAPELDPRVRSALFSLSDNIACLRTQIWAAENTARADSHAYYGPHGRGFPVVLASRLSSDFQHVRSLKDQLQGFVQCRLSLAGPGSMPTDALTWAASWEEHSNWGSPDDPTAVPEWPGSPWAEWDLGTGPYGPQSVHGAVLEPTPPPGGCAKFPYGSTPNGNYIQDDFFNYDLLVQQGNQLAIYRRDNSAAASGYPVASWHQGSTVSLPAASVSGRFAVVPPSAASISFLQRNDEYGLFPHGDFEVLVHFVPTVFEAEPDFLSTYSFSFKDNQWTGPTDIIAGGHAVSGLSGVPVMIESDYGNFELLVPQGNNAAHYWRDNSSPETPWHNGLPAIPMPVDEPGIGSLAFFQSNKFTSGQPTDLHGNFEIFVHLSPRDASDYIANYYYDWAAKRWGGPVTVDGVRGVTGKIACLQNDNGNYVLLAQVGNRLMHYERNNNDPNSVYPNYPWALTSTVPIPQGNIATGAPEIAGFSVFQSVAFRDAHGNGYLELIVHLTQRSSEVSLGGGPLTGMFDYLVTYYFDYSMGVWSGPFFVNADGHYISGVNDF